jgi:uncharacterized protein YhdP
MRAHPLFLRWWSAPFVRAAVWGALGLAVFAGAMVLAYELALARVPQHRATLERLVQAQTGLDVRFNELNLRWGWYGPEAVFHRVELGEPGRSNVLLRAPELIVGFDAWRSVQSGQLQAGRITLIAPDINLERRSGARAIGNAEARAVANQQNRTRLLQRWRGGRIEIEGGTLRLPDPAGSADALSLSIRRASLRHSSDDWSASALVFLPERLGHTARVAAQLEGDLATFKDLSGSVRFEGLRLAFAGWRQVLGSNIFLTRQLPAAGNGDVSFRVSFDHGQIQKADGRVRAQDVLLAGESWDGGVLNLERLRGDWRLARRATGWQLRVQELDLGEGDATHPDVALDISLGGRQIRGELGDTPLESLAAVTNWLAPQIDLSAIELRGTVRSVKFDWSVARLAGERLRATARADDISFAPPARNFTLSGLNARFSANEGGIDIALDTDHGRLSLRQADEHPLEDLQIASELRLSRESHGWHLSTPLLTVDYGATELILSGSLTADDVAVAPLLDVRATLVRADIPMIRDLLGDDVAKRFGAAAAQLAGGRIERAQFQLQTELRTQPVADIKIEPRVFIGSLALRDGHLSGGELWPELQDLDAQLDWNGAQMQAQVDRGHAGSIELVAGQAKWTVGSQQSPQISGQARGRLEDVSQWLGAHAGLERYVPQLRMFPATGEALFNLRLALPKVLRAAVVFENSKLELAEGLPPIQAVRGSLAFDKMRLQRSTLTASWLGGPVTLRIAEGRERRSTALAVQAQGLLDAQQLIALAGFEPLAEVAGQTPWNGEFAYQPAGWSLEAEASLIGVGSRLPEPLAKAVVMPLPLRIGASGSGAAADLRVNLADRMRSHLVLVRVPQRGGISGSRWRVDRGVVHFGSGAVRVPTEPIVAVQGEIARFDFAGYTSLWQRAGNLVQAPMMVADLIAEELWMADRMFPSVRVRARKAAGTPAELDLESEALNGFVRWPAARVEMHLTAQNLDASERARIVTHLQDVSKDVVVTVN